MKKLFVKPFVLVYDNEEGDEAAKAAAAKAAADAANAPKTLTMTQDDLNKMMADNRRKLTQQNEALLGELSGIKEQAKLTGQAKDDLEERIEKLQEAHMSAEEIAKKNISKAAKNHVDELAKVSKDREAWQKRYTRERVATELTNAAIAAKATVPEQIVNLLGPETYLSEVLGDDGKGTGVYDTLISFNDVDDDGKPVTLKLAPDAVLKRMQELPDRFGNLFINPGAGGMGGSSGSGGSKGTPKTVEVLKDTASYMKWRKDNPKADPTAYKG